MTTVAARQEFSMMLGHSALNYVPTITTAKVSDTIKWINKDILAHMVAAINGDWNVRIVPKNTERLVLKECRNPRVRLASNMMGRIIVARIAVRSAI